MSTTPEYNNPQQIDHYVAIHGEEYRGMIQDYLYYVQRRVDLGQGAPVDVAGVIQQMVNDNWKDPDECGLPAGCTLPVVCLLFLFLRVAYAYVCCS